MYGWLTSRPKPEVSPEPCTPNMPVRSTPVVGAVSAGPDGVGSCRLRAATSVVSPPFADASDVVPSGFSAGESTEL